MDALSFRKALQTLKPTAEYLARVGIEGEHASQIAVSFEVCERAVEQDNDLPDATLQDLFSRYDTSRIEVGMILLSGVVEKVSYGFNIGQVEADYLALEAATGEVTVHDMTNPNLTLWKCARDGASFLAAIAEAAKYLSACIAADQSGSELQRQSLDCCRLLAGGPVYEDFYRMLLGVEQ